MQASLVFRVLLIFAGLSLGCAWSQTTTPPHEVVPDSAGLQAAIDNAAPGDVILLEPGRRYVGNFTLPAKQGDGVITIQTADLSPLPEGVRVGPQSAPHMAKIVARTNANALKFLANADNYRIVGVEFASEEVYAFDVILIGALGATVAADQPDNIELDRVYVHGDPVLGSKRGIFINSNKVRIRNSYVSGFKSDHQDAMAIAVCNSPGPVEIDNNYLEGAGHGILFGGCHNGIPGVVPTDVKFTRNFVTRPPEWEHDPSVAGPNARWRVKNLFEIKIGRRMLVDGNIFEHNWARSQAGYAILFTVRADSNDLDGIRFGLIEDIVFSNNIVVDSDNGVLFLGFDYLVPEGSSHVRGIRIENNLFTDVRGKLFQPNQEIDGLEIIHNTSLDNTNTILSTGMAAGETVRGLKLLGNIVSHGSFGIHGSNQSIGGVLQRHYTDPELDGNVIVGDHIRAEDTVERLAPLYPSRGLKWFATAAELKLEDFTLAADSPAKGLFNGVDPGVDMAQLRDATAGVRSGIPQPRIGLVLNGVSSELNFAPGSLLAIEGRSLSGCSEVSRQLPRSMSLCDTTVSIGGRPAPILSSSPRRLLVQAPLELPIGQDTLVEVRLGPATAAFTVPGHHVVQAHPALALAPFGEAARALLVYADGLFNGPPNSGVLRPLAVGESATLFLSGLGITSPPIDIGSAVRQPITVQSTPPPSVWINNVIQTVDRIWALPGLVGFVATTFSVAPDTPVRPPGDNRIWVTAGESESLRALLTLQSLD